MGCQKHFSKLQKMKNTQSEIKPIKLGKTHGTMSLSRILGQRSENDK